MSFVPPPSSLLGQLTWVGRRDKRLWGCLRLSRGFVEEEGRYELGESVLAVDEAREEGGEVRGGGGSERHGGGVWGAGRSSEVLDERNENPGGRLL